MTETRRRWWIVAAVVLVGLTLTAFAAAVETANNDARLHTSFDSATGQLTTELEQAFAIYEYGLRSSRGAVLVAGGADVTAADFETYIASRDLEEEFPGARGFGFVRKVPSTQTEQYVAATKAAGNPDFDVVEIEPNTGPYRYVTEFVEPIESNAQSVGLDLASEDRRRTAADTAAATGNATLSAPLTLAQATEEPEQGFLLLLPVYEPGAPLNTPAEREAATIGWTYAPLVASEVLATIDSASQGLAFSLTATLPDGDQRQEFYRTADYTGEGARGLETTETIEVFGAPWTLRITATDAFVDAANLPPAPLRVAMIGLLATLAAALLAWAVVTAHYRRQHDNREREQRLVSEATAREEQRLQRIVDSTNAGTWEWNVQTGECRFNERWAEIAGYTLAELEPVSIDTWTGLSHPSDAVASAAALERHFAGETDFYDVEVRMRHKDGHWVWISNRGQLVTRTPDGRPEWMFGTHLDITARRELARQLVESRNLLERAGDMARIGGWRLEVPPPDTDPADVPITWTSTTYRLHEVPDGYQPTLASGVRFYTPDSRTIISAAVEHAFETGEGWEQELQLQTWNGRIIWVSTLGEVERDEDGQIVALFGVFQDIDDRKRMEQDLRAAKVAAEAANDAKSRFLANTSHEIRTPLNVLVGLTYLLLQSGLSADQRELVTKIGFAADTLASVINDVLDLSKVESGEMTLEELPLNLPALLAEVVAVLGPTASERGVDLRLDLGDGLPASVIGDATRLRQIITNLVGNAIKFTDPGGSVRASLTCVGRTAGTVRLRLSVADTGIGIAADAQERLFDPFTQAETGTTRAHGGTGLGLSIVQRLVTMMSGEVGVQSELGVGSEFWVEVPLRLPAESSSHPATAPDDPIRVLVASDDNSELADLARLSESLGWRVFTARSAADAANALRTLADSGELPHVLVIRSRLLEGTPGASIRQTAASLGERRGPSMVLVDDDGQGGRSSSAGATTPVLHPPLNASALFNAVNQAADRTRAGTGRADPTAGAASLRGVTIALVDDSELNLLVARRILELHGAEVIAMTSGHDVLDLLAADPDAADALLLDVQMPEIDGNEVARRIRTGLALADLPIIALTADALVTERDAALASGMDAFLTKPFDPELLVATIRSLTGRPPAPVPSDRDLAGLPHIRGVDDTSGIAEIVGDDAAMFVGLLTRLVADNEPERWRTYAAHVHRLDRADLRAQLHRFRGGAAALGALTMAKVAEDMESQIRSGTETDDSLRSGLLRIASTLDDMAVDLDSVQAAQRSTVPEPAEHSPASERDLIHLRNLLAGHDLSALGWLEANAARVRQAVGDTVYAELSTHVSGLDFDAAAALLQ